MDGPELEIITEAYKLSIDFIGGKKSEKKSDSESKFEDYTRDK